MPQQRSQTPPAARVGGDELVVLLGRITEPGAALESVERLLAVLAEPLQVDGLSLHVTASPGVGFYPQARPVDGDAPIDQAGQAMYQAKRAGQGGYRVHPADPPTLDDGEPAWQRWYGHTAGGPGSIGGRPSPGP